jgi:uncharacterized protein (DUF58 family)
VATSTTSAEPIVQQSRKRLRQRLFRSAAADTLPITIRHERIYILPTGRGLAFLGVVSIMLLASMNYRLNLGYALSFILVGLFASGLLSTYLNLVKLTFTTIKAKDTFAGDPLVFQVALSEQGHRGRHSVEISTAEGRDRIDIQKGGAAVASLALPTTERGVHNLGRITLSSDFPLGLWRGWGYVHAEAAGYVYPQPERPVAPFVTDGDGNLVSQNVADEQEFKELRPYQLSDSPASIAWKTVARGGEWYTREFEPPATDSRDVQIKWSATDRALSPEQRLSRMCGWLLDAERKLIPYDFHLPGYDNLWRSTKQRAPVRKQNCLRQLALFDIDPNKS